jgi:LAO/AO transport system kinase
VQPGGGDVLQFLKSGIMEIPDVLVVTKADLGQVAMSALRDVNASLRSLGKRSTRTVAVSSLPPPKGMDELVQGFAQHWLELNRDDRRELTERRLQGRRAAALTDFAVEHGERGLRALGGRRAILALLGKQDPGMDVPALVAALETGLSGCSQ